FPEDYCAVGLACYSPTFTRGGEDSHQHSSVIASFREMLDQDWMIKVEHIYREGNQAADYLAGIGHF
ncbi:hypothetical protein LINPERHAP2_LOCUS32950, partial [Linum perenne]